MSNCKRKIFEVEVNQRRVVPSDPDELSAAIRCWERSMAILFELQDKFESAQANNVSLIQNTTQS